MVHEAAPFQNAPKIYNSFPMDRASQDPHLPPMNGTDINRYPENDDTSEKENVVVPRNSEHSDAQPEAIGQLYPQLTEKERKAAAANLLRYCEVALIVAAKQSRDSSHLTGPKPVPTMKERSNVYLRE